nr:putative late blight resistance protein homolog R1A-10 isoform X2 [Coffea arabica]
MKMQVIDLHEKESCDVGNCIAPQTLWPSLPQASITNIEEGVVVLNDQQQVLIDKLTRGSSRRDVVSIVGMPGIGKTTLAFKVYNDPEVVCYFHIRAWCRVSQAYSRRSLLLDILRHIIELNDTILAMSNEGLDLVLYKHLKKNRYLIFMDDMWSIRAWDDFKISFPDDGNGSRILMTSRLCDVVSKVTPECNLLSLRLLSDDESWELLKLKIFHQESYPEELFEVGTEIARNCKGLPLSVVAIAGILNSTSKEYESWKQIAESLDSLIVGDQQTRCMDILELSYKNLPGDLKACFLYFTALEEDKEISVSKLIRLWMAEGFIQKEASNSLEGLAKDYLMDLIGRSLIIVTKRRSMRGSKHVGFTTLCVACAC